MNGVFSFNQSSSQVLTMKIQHKRLLLFSLWNITCFIVLLYSGFAAHSDFIICLSVFVATLPLAGWLADVHVGRYKVIHYSLWILCGSSILYHILLLSDPYMNEYLSKALRIAVDLALVISLSGVMANSLQFGLDQLLDSPFTEHSSYISWYAWTFFAATLIIALIQSCFCKPLDTKVTFFVVPLFCTLALLSDILGNHLLRKDVVTHNPLNHIYQVLRYAVKNKYPRLRSAFTYWEDKPYSRIDLGKTKYGGPFTTEQVEDVKTFFRILGIIIVACILIGTIFVLGRSMNNMMYHLKDNNYIKHCKASNMANYVPVCLSRKTVMYFGEVTVVIFVPLMKLLEHIKILKHLYLNIFGKLVLGLFLLLLHEILLVGLEVTGEILSSDHNVTCLLNAEARDLLSGNILNLNYQWMLLPQFVAGLAKYNLFKNGIQFICAQSPDSMRGLLLGVMFYACIAPFPVSVYILDGLGSLTHRTGIQYCGVWYYVSNGGITLLFIGLLFMLSKLYSFRRRDEDIHNEQMFAENFYENEIQQEASRADKTNAIN